MLAFGGKLIEDPELKREIAEREAREAREALESLRRKELELLRSLERTRQEVRETIKKRPVAVRSDLRGIMSSPPRAPQKRKSSRRSSPSQSAGRKVISQYDLLPVLTTTGENPLEVGLEKGEHTLPVFRMPGVSGESDFVRHLPTKREIRRLKRLAERRQLVETQVQNTLRNAQRLDRKRTRQDQRHKEDEYEELEPAGLLTSPRGQGARTWEREHPEFGLLSNIVRSTRVADALVNSQNNDGEIDEIDNDSLTALEQAARREGLNLQPGTKSLGCVSMSLRRSFQDEDVDDEKKPDLISSTRSSNMYASSGRKRMHKSTRTSPYEEGTTTQISARSQRKKETRRNQLQSKLTNSIHSVREMTAQVEKDILWVKERIPVTSIKAKRFMHRWGIERLRDVTNRLVYRAKSQAFRIWHTHVRRCYRSHFLSFSLIHTYTHTGTRECRTRGTSTICTYQRCNHCDELSGSISKETSFNNIQDMVSRHGKRETIRGTC